MYFKSNEVYLPGPNWPIAVGATSLTTLKSLINSLLGEEKSRDMLVLLSMLVMCIHLWGVLWFNQPAETPITPPQPLMMEVAMISTSAPKPTVAPKPPAPRPPEKVEPKKPLPKPKPIAKKLPPVVQKPADFAPTEVVQQEPVPQTSQTATAPENKAAPTAPSEQFTAAQFNANYLHNPAPNYPLLAKDRGWYGKVLLRVKVSAEGLSEGVDVARSSGHEILDDSAVEAVQKWRFVPAKRGDTVIASTVLVPIVFNLIEN